MSIARSASLTFPPVSWWQQIRPLNEVLLEEAQPFRKMTGRNRYRIATANGPLLLSVPVAGGRTLKAPLGEVLIDEHQDWQKQHWRSLFSAYGRAPFFEHYGPALEQLLMQCPKRLADFNFAALEWIRKELRLPVIFTRNNRPAPSDTPLLPELPEAAPIKPYSQVFEDRHGFLPGLSILDLLMNEGPAAGAYL